MNKHFIVPILAIFCSISAVAQEVAIDPLAPKRMERDLAFLASDSLKGRLPGTRESDVARDYIEQRMAQYGLEPYGEDGYRQAFPVPEFVEVEADRNGLLVGKIIAQPHQDFYPVAYSANGDVEAKTVDIGYGIVKEDGSYNDYKGKTLDGRVAVMNVSSPDGVHPHSAYAAYHSIHQRLKLAKARGASAVLLINPEKTASDTPEYFKAIKSIGIPVVFVRNEELAKKLTKKSRSVSLSVFMEERYSTGYNLVGFINNGKPKTVVLGAHYDHIGMGKENSLYQGEPAIHNGADDNGSGTTMLLEMLTYYGGRVEQNYNYVILFFSAEESGLIGSKYFTAHPTFPLETVEYMINFDMVGRLRDNRLQVSGTGTAREWDEVLDASIHDLNIKKDPAGVGPSDHTSFYYNNIPVLHVFTGTHEDYHKPSDDVEKINFKGMAKLAAMVYSITSRTTAYEKIEFQKTKSAEQKSTPRFSVTLGVIPDYLFAGPGLKIDGATEGRPAAKAGMKAGDIVVKIGDFTIDDIYAYMSALGAFKKGDSTTLVYLRDGKEIEASLTF